jgi:hypothetical protein
MAVVRQYEGAQQRVATARTCEELVEAANDYLASWHHRDLALIPDDCRPSRVRDVDDLFYWHGRLSETYVARTVVSAEGIAIRRMVGFFLSAAERASHIQRTA